MISHYSGSHYIWTLRQTSIAAGMLSAASNPELPPTASSIDKLQALWAETFDKAPDVRNKELAQDITWARKAFHSYAPNVVQAVPA